MGRELRDRRIYQKNLPVRIDPMEYKTIFAMVRAESWKLKIRSNIIVTPMASLT